MLYTPDVRALTTILRRRRGREYNLVAAPLVIVLTVLLFIYVLRPLGAPGWLLWVLIIPNALVLLLDVAYLVRRKPPNTQ